MKSMDAKEAKLLAEEFEYNWFTKHILDRISRSALQGGRQICFDDVHFLVEETIEQLLERGFKVHEQEDTTWIEW